ncbi:MAG: cobalamin B12-binding domain-containing protein, partial [Candidatus Omnitrophica bacterium]|nr:cobalamin B12-binding domain-containing protein [Candidatus Omnitrophota bacterium]
MKNTEDKILFVLKNENFIAPNGLCRISAMARQAGYNVSLCEVNSQDVLKRIAEFNPKIIAYSACSGEAKHYLKLNRKIKERFPHIFSIMGGPHATFYPQVVKDD